MFRALESLSPMDTPMLITPLSYRKATEERRREVCNGCGPASWKFDLVPDTVYGVSIAEACNIHDWMYAEGRTLADKGLADDVFRKNMLAIVNGVTGWRRILKPLMRRRIAKYYWAVRSNMAENVFLAGKS